MADRWTFLSNHAHVVLCLVRDPDLRLREMAASVGMTERGVQLILRDLEDDGLLERYREGRRNTYRLRLDRPLRHPLVSGLQVRDLVRLLLEGGGSGERSSANAPPAEADRERQ